MRKYRWLASMLLTLMLSACGDDPVLPAAAPLTVDEATIQQLYAALPGPHRVASAHDLILPAAGALAALPINLYYPAEGEGFPLLLFSHGNWSDKDSYDRIIHHWVSHGYAVIAPNHRDCCGAVRGIFNSLRYGELGLIEARIDELTRLLNELASIEQLHPDFAGKADPSRLALTGHSFGAFSAQQFGGATALNPDTQQHLSHLDPAVDAIVALSPPGPMFDAITADSWLALATPMLVTTGTWDIQPSFWPDWRMHLMSWETAIPGDKYALVTEGADHYLGNLICRLQREAQPQDDALRIMQIATTAFLDAYLKQDRAAREFISSNQLTQKTGGFSRLSSR